MSSTQLIEQCATRLRGIVEALDNIHDNTPHRWSTELDDVHSSAESLLALIKDQAPARSEASFEEWLANELEGEDGQPVPAAVCDIALARRAFNHWPKLEQPAKVGGVRFSAGVSSRLVVEAAQRLYEFESTPEKEAERPEVVGYRSGTSGGIYADGYGLEKPEKLMTVAQHERIVGALTRDHAHVEEHLSQQIDILRINLAAKRDNLDAALARVAKLEKQEPVALANRGIHAFWVKWTEAAAGLYGPGIKLYAHPVAQAQHSVPEGLRELLEMLVVSDLRKMRYAGAWRREVHNRASSILALLAAAPGNSVPQAWLDVQAERRRQIEAEGWTPQHDDEHADGQMAQAAGCYALHAGGIGTDWPDGRQNGSALFWPWDKDWWKPTTPRRDLVKACALALAEIERLDRAGISQNPQPGATTASS